MVSWGFWSHIFHISTSQSQTLLLESSGRNMWSNTISSTSNIQLFIHCLGNLIIYSRFNMENCLSLYWFFSFPSTHYFPLVAVVQCSARYVFLWSHGLQHARLPCPSPSPGVCTNSSPLSQWCHPIISFSVIPFSGLRSFPAPGSFPISQFFSSGGQSIGVSASVSVLTMNIQEWFPLGWTGWISLQSKGLSRIFSNTTVQKHQFFGARPSLWCNSHIHTWSMEKP